MGDCSVSRNAQEAIHRALSRGPGDEGTPLALDPGQQRELFDSRRETRRENLSLLKCDDHAPPLIADIQVRIEVMFSPRAQDMMERGRAQELHAELVRIVDEEPAATVMASIRRNTP